MKSSIIFFILMVVLSTSAAPVTNLKEGIKITLSDSILCTFLPRNQGENIGASESDAVAFCNTVDNPNIPDVNPLPQGFIKTSKFEEGDGYVQYTGTIDGSVYGLDPTDGGGQYDSVGAPPGATCAGFDKFVNLIEPNNNLFCIRCCTDESKCDTGHSEAGCQSIIPGQY